MNKKWDVIKTDCMRTDTILAKKIIWCGDGVSNAETLLTNTETQPISTSKEYATFSTQEGKKAALLLDFGYEFAGGVQILGKAGSNRAGMRLRLRFGESAMEAMTPVGIKGACNEHSSRDMEIVLAWNSCQRYGKTGFRFLYIELLDKESFLDLESLQGIFTYRDVPYLGSFRCNDERLNQIYDTAAYTVHLNMQELLWDGIKRDRIVWVGDMHPEILAIRTVFGDMTLIDECMTLAANRFPLPLWPNHMATYGFWYILILWDWYLYNGRKQLITDLADYWVALLKRFADMIHEDDERILREEEFQQGFFLDWPTRDLPEAETAIYALAALTMDAGAKLCRVIGEEELASLCESKKGLLSRNNTVQYSRKQVVAMMWLAGHLDKTKTAELLSEGLGRGMSTFMSAYILKAAKETAGSKIALDMLREYYGGMLDVGATTFWEDFDMDWLQEGATIEKVLASDEYDIHGDNGRFCYVGFRHSLCHGWSAGPTAFLAEEILGIQILEAGCKKMRIEPDLGDLAWAEGTYPTPYGIVTISAKNENGQIIVDVQAPSEIEVVR